MFRELQRHKMLNNQHFLRTRKNKDDICSAQFPDSHCLSSFRGIQYKYLISSNFILRKGFMSIFIFKGTVKEK